MAPHKKARLLIDGRVVGWRSFSAMPHYADKRRKRRDYDEIEIEPWEGPERVYGKAGTVEVDQEGGRIVEVRLIDFEKT